MLNRVVAQDDDPTTFVPAPTVSAPELAWSQDDGVSQAEGVVLTDTLERESWLTTWANAAVILLSGLVLAMAIGCALWAELKGSVESLPRPLITTGGVPTLILPS